MEQTNEIDIGSIYDLHEDFRMYAGLTPKQYITDKHQKIFLQFIRDKRPEIPRCHHGMLWCFIKDHVQWEALDTYRVHFDDGTGINPIIVFTT